ncbi:SurA N-terminal domain-containing protein [Pelomonas sp. SE-A7]|uniref:SurA N-terminal domain-containing protein n=1 Tax=Pelomonas sp. SE-A7 TaxID=3054953 RepID=UPI00259CE816|nr:SurA N-terminal domain-containing protein [Pelomonas sp. SE-A7]MDM4764810.1 SurA N-terminal domain-containing protein [Pelomonas sp. SE-A7]
MFDFVRKHNRLFQTVLLILILPSFVFFGVQSYSSFMDGSNSGVAKVDGQKISRAEFDAAHRSQIERMRAQMPNLDAKEFDTPQARQGTLDNLIRERVIRAAQGRQHLTVTDEKLQAAFLADPQLAFLRNPNGSINRAMLAAQGLSVEGFMQRLREDLGMRQVMLGVGGSSLASQENARLAFDTLLQQREVQLQRFDAKDFAATIKPSDAQIEAFYKDSANASHFQLAESADIEYVVLDLEALKKTVTASDDELRKFYDDNQARFGVPEERRASHILIKAEKGAAAADRAKAKARAEELLAQARKNPAGFADLAKKNSQDEGSAVNGGDLDFFGRGSMVKPFEDAAFALKQGEISEVVESEFGFHVIQLTGKRGGEKKSFDQVRAEIEGEVLKQLAQKRYTEQAEAFRNMVYEQSDSLKPVADKFKLAIQTASVQRKPLPAAAGALASQKLLDEVFGNEALHNKRNTEAVEPAPNQMVSARVVKHNPARLQSFDQVREQARGLLVSKLALEQAVAAGKARLEALKKNPTDLAGLGESQVVSRLKAANVPRKVLREMLGVDVSKLPADAGVDSGEGVYVVFRINRLLPRDAAAIDAKRAAEQYARAWTDAEALSYYNHLKTELKVKVSADAASAPAK